MAGGISLRAGVRDGDREEVLLEIFAAIARLPDRRLASLHGQADRIAELAAAWAQLDDEQRGGLLAAVRRVTTIRVHSGVS